MTATKAQLEERINQFPYWYHKIELPHGLVTPGWAPLSPESYRIPDRLDGKRVLDVGAWDGYWTFEALKRGANQVVAIDDFSDYMGGLEHEHRKGWGNFDLCRSALGYSDQTCQRIETSLYDLPAQDLGTFDVIFFFGTLYHLRYPLMALDILSSLCTEAIYTETAILDDYSPYRGDKGYAGEMVMEFYPNNQYGNNESNWWCPTVHCLMAMVHAAGFKEVDGWKLTETPKNLMQCRGFAMGKK